MFLFPWLVLADGPNGITRHAPCLAHPALSRAPMMLVINNIKDKAGWLSLDPAVP